jgi:vacuolar-type H+-ATPase subunit F/Vma7
MAQPVLISDRLTAAGFRLAGVRALVPGPEEVATVFREVLNDRHPVLITAEMSRQLPDGLLDEAIHRADPPVAVIPDIERKREPVDMGDKVRRALGVET